MKVLVRGIALVALLAGGEVIGAVDDRSDVSTAEKRMKFRDDPTKYWNLKDLSVVPEFRDCPASETRYEGLNPILVSGKGPDGTNAEFFAYYAVPEGKMPVGGWPGLVLVHGGGGTAYPQWVREWRDLGFAVIAMDWLNQMPAPALTNAPLNESNVPRLPLPGGRRQNHVANVANIVLSHSLLRSFKEVNADRTVMVGLSWGSWYGGCVAAVDDRFRGVVEIYCGDFNPGLGHWLVNGRFLHAAKVPMWWAVSTNDQNVTPDTSNAGFEECARFDGCAIVNRLPHSHCGFSFPSVQRMAKYYVGLDKRLPKLGEVRVKDGTARAKILDSGAGIVEAKIGYTTEENEKSHLCEWKYAPADIEDDEIVAAVPARARRFYLAACEKDTHYHDLCGTTKYAKPDRNANAYQPKIVTPEAPQLWEKTAAMDLADYLAVSVGAGGISVDGCRDVVFHVGDTKLAAEKGLLSKDLQPEEWVIRSFGGNVVLNGGVSRGCLYAVSKFLEDFCGVRWWVNGEEDVPTHAQLDLSALDRRGQPHFFYRDLYRGTRTDDPRPAVRNRVNGNGDSKIPAEWGGGCEFGPPYHCHTWNKLVPYEVHGKAHPEWYALRDGKRVGGHNQQMCITNPDLPAVMAASVEKMIAQGEAEAKKKGVPPPKMYDISMNDNNRYCQCKACTEEMKEYGVSGYQLRFENKVAGLLAKKHPDLMFSVFAYHEGEDVPKGGVRAADNILVKLCNTKQNMAAGIDDPTNRYMHDLVKKWNEYAKHVFVWEYSIIFDPDTMGFPFASEFHLADKFRYYAENGVFGLLIEFEHPERSDFYELKYHVQAKALEDPTGDGTAVLEDFMNRFYGKAGPILLEMRRGLDKIRRERQAFVNWFPHASDFVYIHADDMRKMDVAWDAAEAAVRDDRRLLRRVRHSREGHENFKKSRAFFDHCYRARESGVSETPFYTFEASDPGVYTLHGRDLSLVDDPAAHNGKAYLYKYTDDNEKMLKPLAAGVYCPSVKKTIGLTEWKEPKDDGQYQWLDLKSVELPKTAFFLYITRNWCLQVGPGVPELYGIRCRIRLHVRFADEGFYTDRVVFIPETAK